VVGRPLARNRNDCKAWEESGAKAAIGKSLTIADDGYEGTGLVIPHRRTAARGALGLEGDNLSTTGSVCGRVAQY
jgi:hypothetical protein